ncbi:MAG TPA: hypothetical protein VN907_07180, partial [Actinomycetes bacterium]|nr:hypothetical protein [Actinomycetes bacterium]
LLAEASDRAVQGRSRGPARCWSRGADISRHHYWRQLRDMKGSPEVDSMAPVALNFYAGICGWTRGTGAPSAPHPTKGMTTWYRCATSNARDNL